MDKSPFSNVSDDALLAVHSALVKACPPFVYTNVIIAGDLSAINHEAGRQSVISLLADELAHRNKRKPIGAGTVTHGC